MSTLLRIALTLPAACEEAPAVLFDLAPQGWEELEQGSNILYTLHYEDADTGRAAAEALRKRWPDAPLNVDGREAEDWALAWKDFFVPLACGDRFEVLPPWHLDDRDPARTPIIIEPKMAFGTGHHATTALCLEAIGDLFKRGRIAPGMRFLDLGAGSGILGIGLTRLGLTGLGLDIDPQAVACAAENVARNDAAQAMTLTTGSLECLADGLDFDMVVANILSGPLIEMAPDLAARVAPGGCLVLSGILAEQGDAVAAAYADRLPGPMRLERSGEWVALIWDGAA
ncbi:MAG: 50S ribosomal protein L11 methyltransferase [Desulfovibrionaceae bacterium]